MKKKFLKTSYRDLSPTYKPLNDDNISTSIHLAINLKQIQKLESIEATEGAEGLIEDEEVIKVLWATAEVRSADASASELAATKTLINTMDETVKNKDSEIEELKKQIAEMNKKTGASSSEKIK